MKKHSIRFIEERLQQKLPILTKRAETYFRERFYWIVHKFKEQYFENGEQEETQVVFNEVFVILRDEIKGLDLSKFSHFTIGLASSMLVVVERKGCKLKVTVDFFVDQFRRVANERFKSQVSFIDKHLDHLCSVLKSQGIEDLKALKLIEAGVAQAETEPVYEYTELKFMISVINEIIKECATIGIIVMIEMLMPAEFLEPDSDED